MYSNYWCFISCNVAAMAQTLRHHHLFSAQNDSRHFYFLSLSLTLFLSFLLILLFKNFYCDHTVHVKKSERISTEEKYFVEKRKERRHTADAVKMSKKKIQLLITRRRRRDTHTRTRLIIIISKLNRTDRHRHRRCDDVYYIKICNKT